MGKCFQNLKNQELKWNFIWKEPALWCEDSIFYTGIFKGLLSINQDVGGGQNLTCAMKSNISINHLYKMSNTGMCEAYWYSLMY
jgi:hypothetical protein